MVREGLDGKHDCKIHGRPRLLSLDQEKATEGELDDTPHNSGFERSGWSARMISGRILDRFDISYSTRSAIGLAHRLGFSVRKPRPAPYKCHARRAEGVH